eukprot:31021-Pelagococcus_subviridis.AAC.4
MIQVDVSSVPVNLTVVVVTVHLPGARDSRLPRLNRPLGGKQRVRVVRVRRHRVRLPERTLARGEHVLGVRFSVVRRLRRVSPARDDRHAFHRLDEFVVTVQHRRDDRVPELVPREPVHDRIVLVHQRFLQPVRDPVHGVDDVAGFDELPAAAHGNRRGFVADVRELRAGEPGEVLRELHRVDVRIHVPLCEMNLKNLRARLQPRLRDGHLAIEPSGTHQRRVEEVRSVRRAYENDPGVRGEPVHLGQQLVQRLLVLLRPSRPRRRALLAHPRGADADDDLYKLRAGHGVERHRSLARDRFRDERLPDPGPALHEQPFRRLRAEAFERLWVFQKRDHLVEILDDVLQSADVLQGDVHLRVLPRVRPGLRELHRLNRVRRYGVFSHDPEVDGSRQEHEPADGGAQVLNRRKLVHVWLHVIRVPRPVLLRVLDERGVELLVHAVDPVLRAVRQRQEILALRRHLRVEPFRRPLGLRESLLRVPDLHLSHVPRGDLRDHALRGHDRDLLPVRLDQVRVRPEHLEVHRRDVLAHDVAGSHQGVFRAHVANHRSARRDAIPRALAEEAVVGVRLAQLLRPLRVGHPFRLQVRARDVQVAAPRRASALAKRASRGGGRRRRDVGTKNRRAGR